MAEHGDFHITTFNIGAQSGATELPWMKVPSGYGGITVLSAHISGTAAGTVVGAKLVTMTDAGTPAINGTVGSFAGTCVTAAGVVFALTVSSGYVAEDYWIGYDMTSGTVPAGTFVNLAYTVGK
jgi:hypothetical protein